MDDMSAGTVISVISVVALLLGNWTTGAIFLAKLSARLGYVAKEVHGIRQTLEVVETKLDGTSTLTAVLEKVVSDLSRRTEALESQLRKK